MNATEQKLTKEDRQLLQAYTNGAFLKEIIPAFCWSATFLTVIIFVILRLLSNWLENYVGLENIGNPAVWLMSAIIAFSYAIYYVIKEIIYIRKDASGFQEKLQNDLQNGVKTVEKLKVRSYVELEQFEDEGTAFLMSLDDGRVLCVRGQDLDEYAYDAKGEPEEGIEDMRHLFPQTQIEYSYAPETQLRLNVRGIGKTLEAQSRWFLPCMKNTPNLTEGFYNENITNILEEHRYKQRSP